MTLDPARPVRAFLTAVMFLTRVRVPAWVDLEISGRTLDVSVEGTNGRLEVNSVSGDVWIENAGGSVDVRTIEGEIDLQGILGLNDEVRNGYKEIRVDFKIEGDAPREKLDAIVQQAVARSAVYDILANPVPVQVTVNGG